MIGIIRGCGSLGHFYVFLLLGASAVSVLVSQSQVRRWTLLRPPPPEDRHFYYADLDDTIGLYNMLFLVSYS